MAIIRICDGCGAQVEKQADLPRARLFGNEYGDCCASEIQKYLDAVDEAHSSAQLVYAAESEKARKLFYAERPNGMLPGHGRGQ